MALKSLFKDAVEKSVGGFGSKGLPTSTGGMDIAGLPKGDGKIPVVTEVNVVTSKSAVKVR